MNEVLTPYIDSDKKLKIRIEKLLATLYLSNFSGTVTGDTGSENVTIVISGTKTYCDRSLLFVSSLSPHTLFTLKTEIDETFKRNLKEYELIEFTYKIIENIDRGTIVKLLKPIAAEHFSIRPDASKLIFLHNELEPFIGEKKIEIFANFKKHYRTIFFLLLTRFASVVKSTDEERERISEMIKRTNMLEEKAPEVIQEEETVEISEDLRLTNFLDIHEKFKDVFHLFGLSSGFDEKKLHDEYLRMVQRIHPDRLQNVNIVNKERAGKFLRIVSENYELLKNSEERELIKKFMDKYGPIKSRTDFARMKEYDDAIFKGTALLRLGNYEAAAEIFGLIYDQTKNPDALEKKVLALWKKSPRWNEAEKNRKYPEIKEDILKLLMFRDPTLEIFYILAEIYEHLKMIPDCMKVLSMITKNYPNDHRAQGMKKRLMYYSSLEKQEKK